jgi:hypothetical protein
MASKMGATDSVLETQASILRDGGICTRLPRDPTRPYSIIRGISITLGIAVTMRYHLRKCSPKVKGYFTRYEDVLDCLLKNEINEDPMF